MFTGIVEAIGQITTLTKRGEAARIGVRAPALDLANARLGDSIAVSGVCLTVVELAGDTFAADVSAETLARTTLGAMRPGVGVNLEQAMRPTTRLGGHLVSGHVDGVGIVRAREDGGGATRFRIEAPRELARYIAEKGSICVDGVSLTVNGVDGALFDLTVIPHTAAATTLGSWQAGTQTNLEVDLIARYLERLLLGDEAAPEKPTLTREFLARHGYLK